MPIFNCSTSKELSCSLMLSIAPWCLLINSTGMNIKVCDNESNNCNIVPSNNISMPFFIPVSNTIFNY